MRVYTLKSCDTCKKAIKWLNDQGVAYEQFDIRTDGIESETVEHIVRSAGWENALNRRSTTWRALDESQKNGLTPEKAVGLIMDNPTLMKRPAFVTEQEVMVGFGDDVKAWLRA